MADKAISRQYSLDLEKRARKGSKEVVKKVFDFDDDLIKRINVSRRKAIASAYGQEACEQDLTNRDLFSAAVATNLVPIVQSVIELGLVDTRPKEARKPRPRPVDDTCWDRLMDAAKLIDLPGTYLLRACMHLLAKSESIEVDLTATDKSLKAVAKQLQRSAAAVKKNTSKKT